MLDQAPPEETTGGIVPFGVALTTHVGQPKPADMYTGYATSTSVQTSIKDMTCADADLDGRYDDEPGRV